jgi:hypothetical protein
MTTQQIIAVGVLFVIIYFGPMIVMLVMTSLRSRKFQAFAIANNLSYEEFKLPSVLAPNKPYIVRKAAGVMNSKSVEIQDVLVWDGGIFSMNSFGLFTGFEAFKVSQYTLLSVNQSLSMFQRMQRPKFQKLSNAESAVPSRLDFAHSSWYGNLSDIHKYILTTV